MPFTLDNIVQQKTGTFSGSSGTATLDIGTTAGNAVLILAGIVGDNGTTASSLNSISGFTTIAFLSSNNSFAAAGAFLKTSASADETSWTLTITGDPTLQMLWAAFEISGADLDWSVSVLPYRMSQLISGTVAELTSPSSTTSTSETFSGVAIAAFMATSTDTTVPTFTAYSDNFFEIAAESAAISPKAGAFAVAAKQQMVMEPVDCTATHAANAYHGGLILVFTGLDSHHAPIVQSCFGAEVGTATQLTNAVDGPAPWDGLTGSPAIVTSTPRSGLYCMELSATSAAENVTWVRSSAPLGNLGTASVAVPTWVERFHIYFPTSLPSGNVDLASVEVGSLANGLVIRYVSADQKIGVKIGTGTEQLSDTTVVADQWIGIDYFYDPRTTTHTCQWAVDYNATPGDSTDSVAQTTASTSSMTAGDVTTVRKGWTTATTATVRYDDIVGTKSRKSYPIGDVEIRPLKVDPAGTPTVSGSSSNFRTFTNNGTLTAWSAVNTRNALDDIPPTIGASADGLTQTAVADTDYVEVPMATLICAPDYAPLAGRWYWAGWAASGNPANIQCQPTDGSGTEFDLIGSMTDTGFDDTNLVWVTSMHNPSWPNPITGYVLTQTKVDALAARFGFSIDANPDCGVHAVLFELVVQPAVEFTSAEAEDGIFRVYTRQDRNSGAVVSYLATTPATRGATVYGTIGGTDWSQHVDANSTYEKLVGADDISGVTAGPGLTPDQ